jgi:hypothetical protein
MRDVQAMMKGQGGDAAVAETILGKLGMKGGAAQEDLQKALTALKGGKAGEATELIRGIQGGGEFQKAAGEKREAQKRAEDPLSSKIEGHLSDIKAALGKELKVAGKVDVSSLPAGATVGGEDKQPVPSDANLKQDVEPLEDSLETVSKINGRQYTWKKDGTHDVGFIAQELAAVLPEAVVDISGVLHVHYHKVLPLAVEAIKELKAKNDALEVRLKHLEERL